MIVPAGSEFLMVAHKVFATNIDIESSHDESFKLKIPERIAPGNQKVLDCVQTPPDQNGYGSDLAIITRRDTNFMYHKVKPRQYANNESAELESCCFNPLSALKIMWPYVAMSGPKNSVWLFNAYDKDNLKRIVMPYGQNETTIISIYITPQFDMYILL